MAGYMDGVLNVYKEKGFTSFDVVAKLRGILKTKKIGHTGTLDPDAEGVLPVCVGNATKLCDFFMEKEKVYETILLLGTVTDTQDCSGSILREMVPEVTKKELLEAIAHFEGTYGQVPPMYSAIKINGKKLYDLAREGKVVERQPRNVTIYSIELLGEEIETRVLQEEIVSCEVPLRVHCSKGTYIRTLCQDIGEYLGCGGCMKQLKRIQSGIFIQKESHTLGEIEMYVKEDRLSELLLSVEQFLPYKKAVVRSDCAHLLKNGNPLLESELMSDSGSKDKIRLYTPEGIFAAVYEWREEKGRFYPVKMFL